MVPHTDIECLLEVLTKALKELEEDSDVSSDLTTKVLMVCTRNVADCSKLDTKEKECLLVSQKLLQAVRDKGQHLSVPQTQLTQFVHSVLKRCHSEDDSEVLRFGIDCCLTLARLEAGGRLTNSSSEESFPINSSLFRYFLLRVIGESNMHSVLADFPEIGRDSDPLNDPDGGHGYFSYFIDWLDTSGAILSRLDDNLVKCLEQWFVAATSCHSEAALRWIYGLCFATYLKGKGVGLEDLVHRLWESILTLTDINVQTQICSSLSGALFMSNYMKLILEDVRFWQLLRMGMVSPDAPSRKRSIFLLKKSVDFHYNFPESGEEGEDLVTQIFVDYFLLVDALEENQVHIIKPILPKFEWILKKCLEEQFDIAWTLCCLERTFMHESGYVTAWGVNKLLQFSPQAIVLILEQTDFLVSVFIKALNNPSLYAPDVEDPCVTPSDTAQNLINFMEKIFACVSVNKRKSFFESLFSTMCKINWDPVSLYNVTYSLVVLPKCSIMSPRTLCLMCSLVRDKLYNQDTALRTATSQNILQICVNWTDTIALDWDMVPTLLTSFDGSYCLMEVPSVRKHVGFWLKEAKTFEKDPHPTLLFKLQNEVLSLNSGDQPLEDHLKPVTEFTRLVSLYLECNIYENIDFAVLLGPFISNLSGLVSRPYVSRDAVMSSISVYFDLVKELSYGEENNAATLTSLTGLFADCTSQIVRYVLVMMKGDIDLKQTELIIWILKKMDEVSETKTLLREMKQNEDLLVDFFTEKFRVEAMSLHERVTLSKMIAFVCKRLKSSLVDESLFKSLTVFLPAQLEFISSGPLLRTEWGATLSEIYIESLLQCVQWIAVHRSGTFNFSSPYYVNHLLSMLPITGKVTISCLLDSLYALMKHFESQEELELFDASLQVVWKTLFEYRKAEMFKTAVGQFSRLFLSNLHIMKSPRSQGMVLKFWKMLQELSEKVNGVMVSMAQQFTSLCEDIGVTNIPTAAPILRDLLLYGPFHKKDYRIILQSIDIIRSRQQDLFIVEGTSRFPESEKYPRMRAVNVISCLEVTKPSDVKLADSLAKLLLDKAYELDKEKTVFFNNSIHHRLHQRLLQSILILEPLLSSDLRHQVLEWAVASLIGSNTQPSVRYLREWLCVRLLWRSSDCVGLMKTCFDKSFKVRFGSLPSFISIAFHIGSLLDSNSGAEEAMKNLLKMILPYCFARHFNTRLYAQVAGEKLWQHCMNLRLKKVIEIYQSLFDCMDVDLIPDNLGRSLPVLSEDFYFSRFHALHNFSLETIFYQLPRLSNIASDELIPAEKFSVKDTSYLRQFCDRKYSLRDCVAPKWVLKNQGVTMQTEHDADALFQTKMTPWKSISLDENLDIETKHRPKSSLIVVASLIDKAPNLGGLCRTCEIFGAAEYVIGSLKFIESQQFQNLSVSAERWIPIKEVQPQHLKQYLIEMEKQGYALIAAEQTSDSISLEKFTFPEKSLILLGNEKEGIPTDLLQHVHHCVVIPQFGVIRSLNVHVSAALLIWQYTLQRLPLPNN